MLARDPLTDCIATASSREAALEVATRLGPVLALCYPNEDGGCDCGEGHTGRDIGKAPIGALMPNGVKDATTNTATIERWFRRHPRANVGLDLVRAGLLAVDPDSDAARVEAQERGLPPTLVRQSANPLYLYRRPRDCPEENVIHGGKSGALDVLGRGYVVVFGRHRDGCDVFLD